MKPINLLMLLSSLLSTSVWANIVVSDASVRLLPPGVPNTSGYFTIMNKSDSSRTLVGASTDIAKTVELHTHIMEGEMMKMTQIPEVTIAAGETLQFSPGGHHLMMFGLKGPLKEEQLVVIELLMKNGEKVKYEATVQRPSRKKANAHHHHH